MHLSVLTLSLNPLDVTQYQNSIIIISHVKPIKTKRNCNNLLISYPLPFDLFSIKLVQCEIMRLLLHIKTKAYKLVLEKYLTKVCSLNEIVLR